VRLGLGGVDVGIVIESDSSVAGCVPRLHHLRQLQIHPPPGHSYPRQNVLQQTTQQSNGPKATPNSHYAHSSSCWWLIQPNRHGSSSVEAPLSVSAAIAAPSSPPPDQAANANVEQSAVSYSPYPRPTAQGEGL